ncbi:11481_t:CDS:2, partial [Dentiscutata heterogama]
SRFKWQQTFAHAQAIHSSFLGYVWFQLAIVGIDLSFNSDEFIPPTMYFPWYFVIPPLISYTMIRVIRSNSCAAVFYVANLALVAFYIYNMELWINFGFTMLEYARNPVEENIYKDGKNRDFNPSKLSEQTESV